MASRFLCPDRPDAAQAQRRSPSPHPEDVAQGAQLAGLRGGLRQRGSLTLWIEDVALDHWRSCGPGGYYRYLYISIYTNLMVRTAFKLPLRQTEGLMASILTLMGLTISAPDHTTISRRAVNLSVIRLGGRPTRSDARVDRQYRPAGLRGGAMAGGETWREVAPEMVQTASGG
jgi:hypothetical protein